MGQYEADLLAEETGIPVATLMFHNVYGTPTDYTATTGQVVPSLVRKAIRYPRSRSSSHPKLLFVTTDGMSKVLWSPEQLDAGFALASPDGKHLAIQAASHQSNVWLVNQR